MRQVGILAAAGLYAIEHNVARLKDDHANAGALAVGLAKLAALRVEPPQTNMVFVHVGKDHAHELPRFLESRGIVVLPGETLRAHRAAIDRRIPPTEAARALAALAPARCNGYWHGRAGLDYEEAAA